MAITEIERFVESKHSARECEDLIVVTEAFAAVIDGASDTTGVIFAGKSGGRFAAEVLAEVMVGLAPDADHRTFADKMSSALRNAVTADVGELDPDTRWPAACVVCFSASRREVWRIGDCNAVIGEAEKMGSKRVDDAAYGFRAVINSALIARGVSVDEILATDPGGAASRPLHDVQQQLANIVGPWGYGCINGRPVPDEYLECFPVPADVDEIILTSDGYPVVLPTRDATEQHLQTLIAADPAAVSELWSIGKAMRPGNNAPDDRAYLRIALT